MNLFEKYQAQKEKGKELVSRYREAIRETERKIAELKAQYADTLHEEIETGKSKDTQLKKIQGEIDAAIQKLDTLREQHTAAYFRAQQVTPEDVINWWNNEGMPELCAEKYDSIVEELAELKRAYIAKVVQFYRALAEVEKEQSKIRGELPDRYYYRVDSPRPQRKDDREKLFFTELEVRFLNSGMTDALKIANKYEVGSDE